MIKKKQVNGSVGIKETAQAVFESGSVLFLRTGPTSGLSISVYPDYSAQQAGSEVRQKFQAQKADYVREITVF